MKCPECKKTMKWQEGLLDSSGSRDLTVGKHYCPHCNIFAAKTESRAIKKGRRMAQDLVGTHAMDKKITSEKGATQIGILRARQHCATCGYPWYPETEETKCKCTDCNCLYCKEYK